MLARLVPASAEGLIREFFDCSKCDHIWDREVPDPIQNASGWIAGELKPPE
jgi:hypothetical protein